MALNDDELKGKRFGMLTLLYRVGKNRWGDPIFKFKCDCGNEKDILYGSVRRGKTVSCGCYNMTKNINISPTTKTHGEAGTPDYMIWASIKSRCYCETNKDYNNYGARGIKVCDRWKESYENFIKDMGHRQSFDYSIEREDVNGDYCPENCYWLLKSLQAKNRRNNTELEYKGKVKILQEWADEVGIKPSTISKRINNYGWSIEEALTINPKDKFRRESKLTKYIVCFGISWPLRVWSELSGIQKGTIIARIKRGWTPEKAVITPVS